MLQGHADFNENSFANLSPEVVHHTIDLLEKLDTKTDRPFFVKLAAQITSQVIQSGILDEKYPYATISDLFNVFFLFAETAEPRPNTYPHVEQSLRFARDVFTSIPPDLTWLTSYSQAIANTIKAGYADELADFFMHADASKIITAERTLPALENLVIESIDLPDSSSQVKYDLVNTFRTLTTHRKLFVEDAFAIKHIIEQTDNDSSKLDEIANISSQIEDLMLSLPSTARSNEEIAHMATRFRLAMISMTSYTDSDAFIHSAAPDVVKRAIRRTTQPGLFRNVLLSALQGISFVKKYALRHQIFSTLFDEIKYQATLEHARTGGRPSPDVSVYINSNSRADEPPSIHPQERNAMFRDGINLRWRLAKFILGHGGWQFNAKSLPINKFYAETPLILRAARALGATQALRANASSNAIFPGPGIRFMGIDPNAFLSQSELQAPAMLQSTFTQSVLHEYGALLPILHDTTFTFLRGAIIVQNPSIRFQAKQGNKKYNTQLSLVIFNEHFRNSPHDGALLVATKLLNKILKEDTFVDADDYAGFRHNRPDICALKDRLTYDYLMEKSDLYAEAGGIPIINLMALSTIGGSFAKAMPPESAPFMIWQRTLDVMPDDGGHPHYYYAFSEWMHHDTQGMTLEDLQSAHNIIYETGTRAVKLLELFELGYAHYCQGLAGDSNTPESSSQKSESAPDIADSYEAWNEPQNRRMLQESASWHRQHLSATQSDQSLASYPVLCMTPLLQPGVPADNTFYLDTFTMMLTTADGTVYDMTCDAQDIPEHVLEIWQQEVVGKYFGRNMTPRFLHRVHLEPPATH